MNNNQTPPAFILLTDRTDGPNPLTPFVISSTTTYITLCNSVSLFSSTYNQVRNVSPLCRTMPPSDSIFQLYVMPCDFSTTSYRVRTEKNSTRVIKRYCTNYLIIYCHSTRFFFVITPLLQIQNITQMQRPKSNKYKSAFNKVNDWAHKVSTN